MIRDCRAAAANMRSFDPVREGYYEDQAFTFAYELARRRPLPTSSTANQAGITKPSTNTPTRVRP